MSFNTGPAVRPLGVTLVVFPTWVVAILAAIAGVALLLASDQTLRDAGISPSTGHTYGWVQLGFAVVAAIVAVVAVVVLLLLWGSRADALFRTN